MSAGLSGSEGKFEPTEDVDLDADTIHLDDHRMRTGDEVVYDRNGHDRVGGLSTGRTYRVIVEDQNTLRLGETFEGSAVTAADVIVFAGPHGFLTATGSATRRRHRASEDGRTSSR